MAHNALRAFVERTLDLREKTSEAAPMRKQLTRARTSSREALHQAMKDAGISCAKLADDTFVRLKVVNSCRTLSGSAGRKRIDEAVKMLTPEDLRSEGLIDTLAGRLQQVRNKQTRVIDFCPRPRKCEDVEATPAINSLATAAREATTKAKAFTSALREETASIRTELRDAASLAIDVLKERGKTSASVTLGGSESLFIRIKNGTRQATIDVSALRQLASGAVGAVGNLPERAKMKPAAVRRALADAIADLIAGLPLVTTERITLDRGRTIAA